MISIKKPPTKYVLAEMGDADEVSYWHRYDGNDYCEYTEEDLQNIDTVSLTEKQQSIRNLADAVVSVKEEYGLTVYGEDIVREEASADIFISTKYAAILTEGGVQHTSYAKAFEGIKIEEWLKVRVDYINELIEALVSALGNKYTKAEAQVAKRMEEAEEAERKHFLQLEHEKQT